MTETETTTPPQFVDKIKRMTTVKIVDLIGFAAGNPKKRTAMDREVLDNSLLVNGYVMPVMVRELPANKYEILDGHGRVERIVEKFPHVLEIKVLVIDCESTEEGRLIILGLKNQAAFDMDVLDEWVREGLAEGMDADDAMKVSGLTAADLESLAEAGANMLDELDADREDDATPRNEERPTRVGLRPEQVQFSAALTREQSPAVSAALKLAKELTGAETKGDALAAVCLDYELRNRKTAKSAKPSKAKSKKAKR